MAIVDWWSVAPVVALAAGPVQQFCRHVSLRFQRICAGRRKYARMILAAVWRVCHLARLTAAGTLEGTYQVFSRGRVSRHAFAAVCIEPGLFSRFTADEPSLNAAHGTAVLRMSFAEAIALAAGQATPLNISVFHASSRFAEDFLLCVICQEMPPTY